MASGKSTVLSYLNQLGYPTYNCDIINAQLQKRDEKGYLKIIESFKEDILDDNQEINRKKLAHIIFNDKGKKELLESIMHPLILERINEIKEKHSFVFIEVPLLYELGWEKYFDSDWLITCDESLCYERCINDRNMTYEEVKARLNHQMSKEAKIQKAKTRKQKFEEIYHSGDMRGLCQLVKLLYVDSDFFAKPMSLTDKGFLTKIKHNIFDEFAVALQINPEEVEQFVSRYMTN
jgi:dephospho-CoA kinase